MSVDERAAHSVCSPPHPNSGLPEFGILDGRSRVNPTSAGEGVGGGGRACEAPLVRHRTTPLPHKGGGSRPILLHECTTSACRTLPRLPDKQYPQADVSRCPRSMDGGNFGARCHTGCVCGGVPA